MNKIMLRFQAILLALFLLALPIVRVEGSVDQRFSDSELDELFSPIALYPDPLLAQVVPAATFIDQLEDAQRVLGGKSDDNLISQQNWDVSVKSVAHYPQVLQMMVEKRDWTTAVGQAYVNQSTDVAKSIQRLRAEAKSAGNLVTTSQQEVIVDGNTIKIVPAQPQVIYVPQYNPQVVYVEKDDGPSTGDVVAAAAISFGVGMAIGAWLNNDWDWYGRGIYYHGWVGGGWVGVNRTFVNVNVNRNVYVNNRYNRVNINRNINNRNINNYRTTLNRNATVRQQNIARNRTNINRNNINRDVNRNNINRNNINRDALKTRTDNSNRLDAYRGRQTQNTPVKRDNNQSVFSGGQNRTQIQQSRDRGSKSINRMNTNRGGGAGRAAGGGGFKRRRG